MSSSNLQQLANFIWSVADLLRGPYRPPQYERMMLPLTVLRRFDCVLAPSKEAVLKGDPDNIGGHRADYISGFSEAIAMERGAPRLLSLANNWRT